MMTLRIKKTALRALCIGVLTFSTAACEGTKQFLGMGIGAGAGAILGSQVGSGAGQLAAVAIGTLAGAWAGSEIGKKLDHADQMHAQRAAQTALEHNDVGAASSWVNPDSRNVKGVVKPTREFTQNNKRCREFRQEIYVDGEKTEATGIACREKGGEWRVVNSK